MIKKLNEKLNKICDLPRLKRTEVANILKEVYKQGLKNGEEAVYKKISLMDIKK